MDDPIERGSQLFATWQSGHEAGVLDEAIGIYDRALGAQDTAPGAVPALRWHLAQALAARIDMRPDAADTDRLIAVLTELIGLVDQPALRRNRGRALMTRYLRTGLGTDLDAAVDDFGSAFARVGDGDPHEMCQTALDLSWALEGRFDLRQGHDEQLVTYWDTEAGVALFTGPPDLVRSIFVLDRLLGSEARSAPPPDLRWRMKRNLANDLSKCAAATVNARSPEDRAADAVRAVDLLVQARSEMPADSPEAGTVIASLLAALDDSPTLDPALEDQLVTALEQASATALPGQAALIRLNLADLWVARGRIAEGVELFRDLTTPDDTGPAAIGVRLAAADRWAFSALRRATWSEVLEAHSATTSLTTALRASSADWADRYRWSRTSARVATAAASALIRVGRPASAAAALQAGRTLELTERLGGDAAGGSDRPGTNVYLLSTPGGTDALFDVGGTWAAMALPDLAPDALLDRAKPYVTAFDAYRRSPSSAAETWMAELEQMITFLDAGLQPLRRGLPAGDLTVVPVGLLSMLPLAAALLDASPTRGVSIVPTLRRRADPASARATRNLVVADPALNWAEWEAAAVSALLAPATTVAGTAPRDVLASLPAHGVVHFACHGTFDLGSPLASRLDLPGGRLTVGDVLHRDLPPVALVVLSACETGLTDPHQFDEGIAFPAAFIAATGADVLSTLWKVDDLSTSMLVLRFYWELRHDAAPGPLALARAQSWQRSTSVDDRCRFLAEAHAAGVLTGAAVDSITAALRKRCPSGGENPFTHPYHWAGFTYAS